MEYKSYQLGDMKLSYMIDDKNGHTSMFLLPLNEEAVFEKRRRWLNQEETDSAWEVGSLCHLAVRHHSQGNGAGGTLKYGESVQKLKFKEQLVEENETQIRIITELSAEEYSVSHIVTYIKDETGIEVESVFQNQSNKIMTLDMFTSFSLDNLSPLQKADGAYSLYLHRFHGGWSLEGKHQEDSVERLNLESTWIRAFPESERYGSVGSFPVKRWFPFGCVEDREQGVFWAAQLASNSSWQMEFSRDGDCYSLSGGLGDCETSGWWKQVLPGEIFCAPKAYLSTGKNFEKVCQNITGMFRKFVNFQPACEQELSIWFNEWCTSWGHPTHQSVVQLKECLNQLPVAGIIIDAGWSVQPEGAEPQEGNGDWKYDKKQFPQGLKTVASELKKVDLDLGIWMEFEVTTKGAKVHQKEWDYLHLKRNDEVIQTGKIRRFWDFRKPETIEYLKEKVIEFLRSNRIRYLKVDYNGSIGIGCDGAESLGEGLRQQMSAVYKFFQLIRKELPELVIENCASGGHRLEPLMVSATSVSSFSDAHECREIPYIAANLHYLILPRQSLIWAVIRPDLSDSELYYRITSTLLGRMCLSGNIAGLNQKQSDILKAGCTFYQKCRGIIKEGESRIIRNSTENQHHLKGSQILIRQTQTEMLLIFHAFEKPDNVSSINISGEEWKLKESFGEHISAEITEAKFSVSNVKEWQARAFLFELKSC